MFSTKTLTSSIAATALVATIGFAYAQSEPNPGTAAPVASQTTTTDPTQVQVAPDANSPSTSSATTPSDATTLNGTTLTPDSSTAPSSTGMSSDSSSANNSTGGDTSSTMAPGDAEPAAQADRN